MPTTRQQFEQAQADLQALTERPDNETLLELYSLYKQATEGDASGERPGPFEFKARAKYDAWADRRGMDAQSAMDAYVKMVARLKSA